MLERVVRLRALERRLFGRLDVFRRVAITHLLLCRRSLLDSLHPNLSGIEGRLPLLEVMLERIQPTLHFKEALMDPAKLQAAAGQPSGSPHPSRASDVDRSPSR